MEEERREDFINCAIPLTENDFAEIPAEQFLFRLVPLVT